MILFLSKLVPIVLYPLGLAIVLTILALLLGRFRRISQLALRLVIVLLWLPAMPVTANLLSIAWEAAYPQVPVADLPRADVIVLLGGFVGQPVPPRVVPDLNASVDRLFEAARLYHAGKAAHIVATAGDVPWDTVVEPEAHLIGGLLGELGVPASAVVLESKSRNTRENAVFTKPILADRGWHSVLLVTSASHMRRAMAAFRHAGMAVTAATADVDAHYPIYGSMLDFLPNAGALADTTNIIHEAIGLIYYRLRGWA